MLAEKLRLMLEEAGVSFKTNTKSFVMGCPRCRKREKLYIRKTDGRFVCWVCNETEGYHGAAEWCLTDLTGKPVDQIRRYLYGETAPVSQFIDIRFDEFFGVDDEIPVFVEVGLKPLDDDPGFRALDTPAGAAGAAYLAKRKVPTDIALQYGIKAWPAKKSVVFPVVYRGVQVGWQTRYIGEMEVLDDEEASPVSLKIPKAMTSLGLKKEKTLMFADRIVGDWVVLCEGPVDALKAHLCGGNVAALGKGVSKYQLELIRHSGIKRLYLALDPDAFVESSKILKEMSQYVDVFDMRPPKGYEDIGQMAMEDVKVLFDTAPKLHPAHLFMYLKDHYAD
jgi:hypothetical protein